MKVSEYANSLKTNTQTSANNTTKSTGKLSDYAAKNNIKPATSPKSETTKAPVKTPLMNALSTGKTSGVKTNAGTSYKPIGVPTSAARMAALGITNDTSPKAVFDTTKNVIENKATLVQPVAPDPTTLERVGNTVSGGLKAAAGGTANAIEMLGKSPINPMFFALEQYNNLLSPKLNKAKDKVLTNTAEKLMNSSSVDIEKAKQGASGLGKFAVDAGSGLTQLGASALLGGATGGGALVPMALQAFGSGAYQAKQAGASVDKQVLYGDLQGAATGMVEGLSNVGGALTKAFGKGALDDILGSAMSKAINRFATSEAGKLVASKLATGVIAGLGEGFENIVQDALTPVFQKLTYDKNAQWDAESILYDALQGVALGGLLGTAGKPMTDTAQSVTENVQKPVDNQTNAKADVDTNVNPLVPNIGKTTQNIAPQLVQSPTVNESAKEVKLPANEENATEAKQSAPETKYGEYGQFNPDSDSTPERVLAQLYKNGVDASPEIYQGNSKTPILSAAIDVSDYVRQETISAESAGRALAEAYKANKGTINSVVERALELDGKPMPEWYRKQYHPTEDEAKTQAEEDKRYQKGIEDYKAQLVKIQAKKPSTVSTSNPLVAKITKGMPEGTGAMSNPFVPEQKTSKVFTNTFQKTDSLTDAQKAQMKPENYQYDVRGKAVNEAASQQRVDNDYEGEVADLYAKQEWTDEDVYTSKKILDKISAKAETSGDFAELNKWTKAIQKRGTSGGQTIEAFKAFQKTPEGAVIKAQQVVSAAEVKLTTKTENGKKVQTSTGRKISSDVENVTKVVEAVVNGKDTKGMAKTLNKVTLKDVKALVASGTYDADAINALVRSKYGIPTMTTADVQKIYELNKLAQETNDDYQKRAYLNQAARVIAEKLPVSAKDKVLAIRRISMLLNPKTLISRNAGGNVIFGLLDDFKDAPGTVVDILTTKIAKTDWRTTSYNPLATAKAEFIGAKKGLTEWGKDIKNNVDTSPTEHEMPRSSALKSKVGAGAEALLYKSLQLGDRPFYEAAYAKRIDELKRLGLDYTSEDANGQAMTYALEKVFQNNSELAKKAIQMRKSLGVLGDVVIPFAQTPSNILDKLIDYSPYGYVRAIKKAGTIKDSAWSQKQFVDTLSRSLTGTGILAFAFYAAKSGLITGGDNKDEDEALTYQKKMSGWQPYSIVVGDKSYTYDWANPVGTLLGLGADMAKSDGAGDTLSSILMAGAKAGVNTFFNQSYMEGLAGLFGGEDAASGLESLIIGLPASFTPTAFQQIAKLIDPIARDTYDSDPLKKAWNKVKAKVPFLSQTLPAKIGATGNPLTNFQGSKLSNIFESTLSPGFIGETQKTAVDTEAQRLYKATGDTAVLPNWSEYTSKSDLSFSVSGTTYTMTAKEWEQYQTARGQATYKDVNTLINSKAYKSMSDTQKADVLSETISYANDKAKREYLDGKGKAYESGDYEKVYEAEQAGISPTDYFIFKGNLGEGSTQLEKTQAIEQTDLSSAKKGELWQIQNATSNPDKNPYTGTLAQAGLTADKNIEIMAARNEKTHKDDFIAWLAANGYNATQIQAIWAVYK